ncbi:MAG: FumA C-terminus/TtdB family hydratase beta subunit [Conexivisphaera sp.]
MAEYHLRLPMSESDARSLRVGDVLYVTGKLVTARDEAHKKVLELLREGKPIPVDLRGLAVYHCGPVVERVGEGWRVVAAGPTTSARMESVEPEFIERTGVRLIIGKGGLGRGTAAAAQRFGAAYAVFTGGAGVLAAESIKRVLGVHWLEELGMAEAMWELEVEEFGPLAVTIDSHGRNFYAEMEERRRKVLDQITRELGF